MKKHISLMLILAFMLTALVGCGGSDSYTDGIYEGEAMGMDTLRVSVEISEGNITSVEIIEENESEGYKETALEAIPAAIVESNSTDVDAVAGATVTSNAIIEAVNNALESAK